jgi:hypothetical protein
MDLFAADRHLLIVHGLKIATVNLTGACVVLAPWISAARANEKSHNFRCQRSSPPKLNNNRNRDPFSKANANFDKPVLLGFCQTFSVNKKTPLLNFFQSG